MQSCALLKHTEKRRKKETAENCCTLRLKDINGSLLNYKLRITL